MRNSDTDLLPPESESRARFSCTKLAMLLFLLFCLVVGGILSVKMGWDVYWDNQHYHYYNAYAFLHGRWGNDIIVAGSHSFFSPFADIPYYLLSYEWLPNHPRLVAFLMGLPAGFAAFLTFFCIYVVFRRKIGIPFVPAFANTLVAGIFGLSGFSFLTQVGAGTNEIYVAIFILLAIIVILVFEKKQLSSVFFAGIFLGLATVLKWTALSYALPFAIGMLFLFDNWKSRLMAFVSFSLGWWLAFLLGYSYWGFFLFSETGNPFFPMLNSIFQSEMISSGDMDFDLPKSKPKEILEKIFFPFYFYKTDRLGRPLPFSDLRFAFVQIALLSTVLVLFIRKIFLLRTWAKRQSSAPQSDPDAVAPLPLFCFFATFCVLTFLIWEFLFGVLRYLVALECLLGLLLFLCFYTIAKYVFVAKNLKKISIFGFFFVAIATVVSIKISGRYSHYNWGFTTRCVEADIPPIPNNSFVLLGPTTSWLAPLIEKQSPEVTFAGIGDWRLETKGPSKNLFREKVIRKIHTHPGPVFVIIADIEEQFTKEVLPIYRITIQENTGIPIKTNQWNAKIYSIEKLAK